jgi:hypothetical protein
MGSRIGTQQANTKESGYVAKSKTVKSEPECVFSEFLQDLKSFQQTSFNNRGESAGTSRVASYEEPCDQNWGD